MAKNTMKNINQPTVKATQVTQQTEDDKPKNYPISVYVTEKERDWLDDLARGLGVSRHSLMQYGIRYFMKQYRDGKIEIPTETKTVTEIQSP